MNVWLNKIFGIGPSSKKDAVVKQGPHGLWRWAVYRPTGKFWCTVNVRGFETKREAAEDVTVLLGGPEHINLLNEDRTPLELE